MKKVISFCVWGNKAIYNYGVYENALLLPKIFPDWHMVVYHTKTANLEVMKELKKIPYVQVIEVDFPNHYRNSMLRFIAAFNPTYDAIIFRDADSRLLHRDRIAVNEWLKTEKPIHVMRDYPTNGRLYRISAGMWGVRNKFLLNETIMKNFSDHFSSFNNEYRIDEIFLFKYVYPLLTSENSVIHSQYCKYEPWATKFPASAPSGYYNFVGKTFYLTEEASKKFNDPIVRQQK